MDALALIHDKLAPIFAVDLGKETAVSCAETCENCGRESSAYGGLAYPVTDAYGSSYYHCPACRILTIQAPTALGIDRMAGNTPIGYKLSSFKGGYLVIPVDGAPELWLGGKYPDKLANAAIAVKNCAGNAAKRALLDAPCEQLVIEVSLRRERFTRYLSIGTAQSLHIASETGMSAIPFAGWPGFAQAWQQLPKKTRAEAIIVLRALTQGTFTSTTERVQAFWQANPDFTKACQAYLPLNPYARLFYVDAATMLEARA